MEDGGWRKASSETMTSGNSKFHGRILDGERIESMMNYFKCEDYSLVKRYAETCTAAG